MAINKKKKKEAEPVTNSCSGKRPIGPSGDQLGEVDAKCDHLKGLSQNVIVRWCGRNLRPQMT